MECKVRVLTSFVDSFGNNTTKSVVMTLPEDSIYEREEGMWALTSYGERIAREKIFEMYSPTDFIVYSGIYVL